MAHVPYPDDAAEKLVSMVKAGDDWEKIARHFDRTVPAVKHKFWSIKNAGKMSKYRENERRASGAVKVKRQYTKKVQLPVSASPVRPMLALVGTPEEVTKTIKELFS